MLIVKVMLWPMGKESEEEEIGRVRITNDGTGTSERGNYEVVLEHSGYYRKKRRKGSIWKKSKISNHRRALSVYHLIKKAITAALKEEMYWEPPDYQNGPWPPALSDG